MEAVGVSVAPVYSLADVVVQDRQLYHVQGGGG